MEVCREIRTFSDCYIIMVTARDDEVDKLIGLGLGVGVDDYITKPFSPRLPCAARAPASSPQPWLQAPAYDVKGVSLDVEEGDHVVLVLDRDRIQQVLPNLLECMASYTALGTCDR